MQEQQNQGLPRWRLSARRILALLVLLGIVYLLYGVLFPSAITITTTRSLTLAVNQTQFLRIYVGNASDVKLRSATPQSASFYITRVPVLYSPVVSFSVSLLTSLNVSTEGSKVADINILLLSSSNSSATIQITPLPAALGVKPSPGVTLLNPASLTNIAAKNTTTVTSVASTTTAATTSVSQNATATLFQQALADMNLTGIGALMKNFKVLYNNDKNCTATLYNTTYKTYNHYHTPPPAPVSFLNVSPYTPTDIKITVSNTTKKNNALVTYSTVAPSSTSSGPAVLAVVNVSSISFLKNLTYIGVYLGLNYTKLNSTYTFEKTIPNACAALVPQ